MTFPTLLLDAQFTAAAGGNWWHIGDSARGKIGTAAIGPNAGLWTSIPSYATSVSIRRGASRVEGPALRYEAGTIVVELDNSDRRFDPTNLAGPYVAAGATQVTPMRGVRVRATHNGVTYDLARGFADSWQIAYSGPGYSTCTLTATDATKILSNYDRAAVAAVGASERSGARVNRILDSASWPSTDRVISAGDSTMQATDLSGNAWTELLLVQDSELGELYVDAAGRVVFRNRQGILEDARSTTSQATFGDLDPELPYTDIAPVYDEATIANLFRITRVGGVQQVKQDATSISKYLTHTYERADLLLQTDAETASWAGWALSQAKDPEFAATLIVIDPQGATSADEDPLFVQCLSRQIGDRITTIRRPPGGGAPITQESFIRGIAHDIRERSWRTTWQLQAASRLSFWTLGHATLGQVGTVNAIAF